MRLVRAVCFVAYRGVTDVSVRLTGLDVPFILKGGKPAGEQACTMILEALFLACADSCITEDNRGQHRMASAKGRAGY